MGTVRTPRKLRTKADFSSSGVGWWEWRPWRRRPRLPTSVGELRLHNLEVGGAHVDLLLVRHDQDVGVNVLRRDGDVQIVVVK